MNCLLGFGDWVELNRAHTMPEAMLNMAGKNEAGERIGGWAEGAI